MKDKTYITITRQYGSGGMAIAEEVAKKLGLKCYNRNIVIKAAENIDNAADINTVLAESYDTPNDFLASLSFFGGGDRRREQMYFAQAKVITEIAKQGSAVFVGRCADYILREEPNRYSIFIYADDDHRREVAQRVYKDMSFEDVLDVDAKRKRYYAYYTGQTWGDMQNYDLMINTTKLTTEEAAQIILDFVALKQK